MTRHMTRPLALAALLVVATTGSSALAATPIMSPLRHAAAASQVEAAQYRPMTHQHVTHTRVSHSRAVGAYGAYGYVPPSTTGRSTAGSSTGSTKCEGVTGLEGSTASAFPMWDVCR